MRLFPSRSICPSLERLRIIPPDFIKPLPQAIRFDIQAMLTAEIIVSQLSQLIRNSDEASTDSINPVAIDRLIIHPVTLQLTASPLSR